VLAGSEIALLDRTLVREALSAFEEQLHALAAAEAAYCVFITRQVFSLPWIVGREPLFDPRFKLSTFYGSVYRTWRPFFPIKVQLSVAGSQWVTL
jgi:hypothetical protein